MLTMALVALVVPAVVAAALTGLGRAVGGRWGGCPEALAVGLAYVAGQVGVARPAVPPVEVTDRIPWVALAAAVLAAVEAARPARPALRVAGRSVLAALAVGLILEPVAAAGDLSRDMVVWLAGSGALALAAWASVEALGVTTPRGSHLVLALLVTTAGAGVVLLLSGSAVLGFLGLALAAALAGGWLAGLGVPPSGSSPAALAVLTALVLEGFVYASVPVSSALLLALAPSAAWLGRLGPSRRFGPWASATVVAVAVLIPVAVAVGLAASSASPSDY